MNKKLIKLFIILDIVLALLHLVWGKQYGFFDLDVEYNLPTFYQGVKAILIGWLLLKTVKFKFLGFLTICLGLDEILVIHEKTEMFFREAIPNFTAGILHLFQNLGYKSSTWVLLLSPLLVAITIFVLKKTKNMRKKEKNILIISIFLFGIALISELINTSGKILPSDYYLFTAIEETAEMLAITNFLRLKTSR